MTDDQKEKEKGMEKSGGMIDGVLLAKIYLHVVAFMVEYHIIPGPSNSVIFRSFDSLSPVLPCLGEK